MSKVGRWSTAAGSNNSTPPDGWPEGQAPSTVNDCAREMMASIRAMVNDLQYIDQDFTPTWVSATSFSVPGNQTSAIHTGRRLKLFDATAGLGVVIYATVVSATFAAATTITVENDTGALTSSLSSFAVAILSNDNNSIPRDLVLTVSAVTVLGSLTISGTAVAANIPKAFVRFAGTVTPPSIFDSFNVSSVSKSGTGVYRVNFTTPMNSTPYVPVINPDYLTHFLVLSAVAASCKFLTTNTGGVSLDAIVSAMFFCST